MNNFLQRSLTGSIYVGIIVGALLTHPIVFVIVTFVMNFFALKEFMRIQSPNGSSNKQWPYISSFLLLACLILLLVFNSYKIAIIPLFLLFSYLIISTLYTQAATSIQRFMLNSSATVYITIPLILLNVIHYFGRDDHLPYILLMFLFIWANDSFAYLFGISLGKHRLFERISPKKSWEGFFGGWLSTLLLAYALYRYYEVNSLVFWLLFASATVIASTFGDLFESALKRIAGVKDSGTILPGHGGILDRIDSLLFVSPIIYIYLLFY